MEEYLIYGVIAIFVLFVGYQFKKKKKKEDKRPIENGILVDIRDPATKAKVETAIQMILLTPWKEYVIGNISIVKDANMTGIDSSKRPATFGVTNKYVRVSSMKWLASTFVHESRHVEQRHDLGGYKGQESELDANKVQASVLRYLGASKVEIDYLEKADGLHFDSNGNGILDPLDNWGY